MSASDAVGVERDSTRPQHLVSLTGLRGILALMVFGTHFYLAFVMAGGSFDSAAVQELLRILFSRAGGVAVSCFFLLSGFVLTFIARPDDTARSFYRRRIAKVYPVHLVTLAVAFAMVSVHYEVPGAKVTLAHVFLVQDWVPSQWYYLTMTGLDWSLSCEAFFYLCFPALLYLLTRARTWMLYVLPATAVVLIFGLPHVLLSTFSLTHPDPMEMVPTGDYGGPVGYWFAYVFPPMRMAEFVIGICLALLVRRGAWRGPGVAISLVLCALGWWATLEADGYLPLAATMVVPFALLIAALSTADLNSGWSPLRVKPLVWFGEISLSFYVSHLLVQEELFARLWNAGQSAGLLPAPLPVLSWWVGILSFTAQFLLALAVAWLLYRLVELPMVRRLRPKDVPPLPLTAAAQPTAVPPARKAHDLAGR
ncbi:acyltransferase [Streptomyces minutiscleroticus]|uniref:Acyltransferase n=1 Tax=Streptomyces minutiscleroticus TaxID=68238 RepID=A0A918U1H7_9ACTN|nr:acyltransferase [Streptomyces minutiscleroticus]GGX79819.1 acyltransferase [Streptomyces minutiscleroticus]